MHNPTREVFLKLARQGNLIPVYREILADMETPVSALRKLAASPYAILLESVEGGEKWGRYSFISNEPSLVFQAYGREIEIIEGSKCERRQARGDVLAEVKEVLGRFRPVRLPDLPRFIGGAVGYIAYDTVRQFERLPDMGRERLDLPDVVLVFTNRLVVFDNVSHKMKVIVNAFIPEGARAADLESIYDQAVGQVEETIEQLRKPVESEPARAIENGKALLGGIEVCEPGFEGVYSNMARAQYEEAVSRAIEYIRAGDIIQVVLAQRFQVETGARPLDIYRALRTINPSPYMFFLKLRGLTLAGSSPEVLVRLEEGVVTVRPIAGTRVRGRDANEDERLVADLLADPKERAEHVMLVDLGRNDVGRVAETGSVSVEELMTIEKYSHVMHIVSNVAGKLKTGLDMFDVFRSCFPAGTLSGAPKIRAMEIIEELETSRRGPYGGAVGFFSFSGNMDTGIAIRTVVMKNGVAYMQVGAGIVADSVPANEYRETLNKSRAMINAIRLAEAGLD